MSAAQPVLVEDANPESPREEKSAFALSAATKRQKKDGQQTRPQYTPAADHAELFKPPRATAPVWEVFRDSHNPGAKDWVFCLGCLDWVYFKSRTPSNLQAHVSSCPKAAAELKKRLAAKEALETIAARAQPTLVQAQHKVAQRAASQEERARRSVMDFITDCNLPLATVDQPSFRNMLSSFNSTMERVVPHRKLFGEQVQQYFDRAIKFVRGLLAKADGVSFTCDSATTVTRTSLFAVTAHFIDPAGWDLCSLVLALKQLSESHTAVNISSLVSEVVKLINADQDVSLLVTDGAANMIATQRILRDEDIISEGLRCMCHTLNLSVVKALEIPELEPLLSKCHTTINSVRNSPKMSETFCAEQIKHGASLLQLLLQNVAVDPKDKQYLCKPLILIKDVVTRWWSTYSMLQRLYDLRVAVNATLLAHAHTPFSHLELLQIDELLYVLAPFAEATRTLEGEQYPTLGMVFPILSSLLMFLGGRPPPPPPPLYGVPAPAIHDDLPDWSTKTQITRSFKDRIRTEMNEAGRFDSFPTAVYLATVLDPRFHSLPVMDPGSRTPHDH